MAIDKMKKVSIIALQDEKDKIVEALMKAGVIHVIDMPQHLKDAEVGAVQADGGETGSIIDKIEKLKFTINYLSRYDTSKKTGKKSYLHDKLRELEQEGAYLKTINKVHESEKYLSAMKTRAAWIANRIEELKPWIGLDIDGKSMEGTSAVMFMTGTVPVSYGFKKFKEYIYQEIPESYAEEISIDSRQHYVFIAFHRDMQEKAVEILKDTGFNRIVIDNQSGTPENEVKNLQNEARDIEIKKAAVDEELKKEYYPQLPLLKALYDYFMIEKEKKDTLRNLVRTDKTFMAGGWVPADSVNKAEEAIRAVTQHYWMEVKDPEPDEEYPIKLKNNIFVRPFELVTQLYSLPNTKEIDPNAVMAPFYFLFFGIMVSDAGYGLTLSLITAFILWKFKPQGMLGKLTGLLFLGGLSTAFWGTLFGGWFGNILPIFGIAVKPVWFDPIQDPMKLLIFSFVLGIIHLYTGIGVKAYRNIKNGRVLDALFDQGFWYLFITGLIFLLVPGMSEAGKYMSISGAILLILTQGRSEKGILKKILTGVLSLYGASGFMSDVLSYSRLLALGLGTGVIAVVVNTMGTLFGFNLIGYLILTVVFVIGHAFNILINVLGAYVHSSRLQYVEFFGKFYEGGGKPYSPLKINTKYTNIKDREE